MNKSISYYLCGIVIFSLFFLKSYSLVAQDDLTKISTTDSLINQTTSSWGILIGGGFNQSGLVEIGFGGSEFRPLKYLLGKDKTYFQKKYMVGQVFVSSEFIFRPNHLVAAPKVGVKFRL